MAKLATADRTWLLRAIEENTRSLGGGGVTVSENFTQIGGTAVDVGAGASSPGTQRIILSSDQAALLTSNKGAINLDNNQVTAGTSAGTLVIARPTRISVLFRNMDSSISVYIGKATVTSGNGMLLKAGESTVYTFAGLIQVIAASGAPVVAYADEYN